MPKLGRNAGDTFDAVREIIIANSYLFKILEAAGDRMNDPMVKLLELDTRHNDLLDRLADLDRQVDSMIQEWAERTPQEDKVGAEFIAPSVKAA